LYWCHFHIAIVSPKKSRPAVVVSNTDLNADGDIVIAAITSHEKRHARDIVLREWKAAGLQLPSTVKILIATLSVSRIVLRIGTLSPVTNCV
jgi:mRNA-degrading endonuclease toxin of MazEF toxin-antitoxin module